MAIPESPLTRVEQFLYRIATGSGTIPNEPLTRIEQYLDFIVRNGAGGKSELLEEIRTYTCDGTETSNFKINADNDGNPFHLKKMVVRVTLGTVTTASNITITPQHMGSDIDLANFYASYSASATGQTMYGVADQDGGFWVEEQTTLTVNGYGQKYTNSKKNYMNQAATVPYVDQIRITDVHMPAGTIIQILGVRE